MANNEKIWNLPNILSILRVLLIGVFIWLFASGYRMAALGVFLLAGFTDFLDGYIARSRNLITNFGKLMDPIADKLMLITALSCLTSAGLVPLWLVITVAVKELLMVVGGYFLLKQGVVVHSMFIGKAATVVFIIAIAATFLHDYTAPWDMYLQMLALILSVSSMVWYAVQTIRGISKSRTE